MATGAIVAGVVGGAMAAGGIGAAVRASKIQAQPKRVYYNGSADALNETREQYGDLTDAGAARTAGGVSGLEQAGASAQSLQARGAAIMDSTRGAQPSAAYTVLQGYRPGEAAALQARQAMDTNAQANLGAARSGGALGLRNALNANAFAGVQSAQESALARSQEEQALLGMKVGTFNADRAARLQTLQTGAQLAQGGNAQAISAAGNAAQVGLAQERTYLDALQNVEDRQFSAEQDYEQRRQAERQRRSDRLWQLGGSLISGGGQLLASSGGGGGGNSGGGGGK